MSAIQPLAISVELFGNDLLAYCIRMRDGEPEPRWDFNSLKLAPETIYSFYITGENCPFRVCKDYGKVFHATSMRAEFCAVKRRNRHIVAVPAEKSRRIGAG